MVDPQIIHVRLSKLASYLQALRGLLHYDRQTFAADPYIHASAERYLQLSAEAMIDLANHLLADRNVGPPHSYRQVFEWLGDEGLVDRDLAERLQDWASFRNILVHFYVELDLDIVFDTLHGNLGDVEAFAAAVALLLGE